MALDRRSIIARAIAAGLIPAHYASIRLERWAYASLAERLAEMEAA